MKMRLELNQAEGTPMRFGFRDDSRDLGLLWKHHQVFPKSKLSMALIGMFVPLLAVMVCGVFLMMKFSK